VSAARRARRPVQQNQPSVRRSDFDVVLAEFRPGDFDYEMESADPEVVRMHNLGIRRTIARMLRNEKGVASEKAVVNLCLESLQGSMDTRIKFVEATAREAKGFGKASLVVKLNQLGECFKKLKIELDCVQEKRQKVKREEPSESNEAVEEDEDSSEQGGEDDEEEEEDEEEEDVPVQKSKKSSGRRGEESGARKKLRDKRRR
jgi:hypothetical protein